MAILEDFEVKITTFPHRNPFHEYENPTKEPDKLEKGIVSLERYIEAETGMGFQIEVFVKPTFRLFGATGIRIHLDIDEGVVGQFKYIHKDRVLAAQKNKTPLIDCDALKLEGTQYSRINFSFGALEFGKPLLDLTRLRD